QAFRGLRKLGMRDEIAGLLQQLEDVILEGQSLKALRGQVAAKGSAAMRALLHIAAGWYYFDRDKQAEAVLNEAKFWLYQQELLAPERPRLACAYVAALAQAPGEGAQKRIDELFHRLEGIRDTYTTNTHYSQSQLNVVEAVVQAVVTDDFTLGKSVR